MANLVIAVVSYEHYPLVKTSVEGRTIGQQVDAHLEERIRSRNPASVQSIEIEFGKEEWHAICEEYHSQDVAAVFKGKVHK